MQVNVSQLLQESIGATREYSIDEPVDVLGDGKEFPVRGSCRLLRTQRSILVKCSLDTQAELECNRCLGRFRHPLKIRFEEEYVPTVDVASGAPLPQPEEPGTFTIDEHHVIDISEALRQYAVMAMPMKILCAADCAGLCQSCGKNLNRGACDCPKEEIDPRWSALMDLKQ